MAVGPLDHCSRWNIDGSAQMYTRSLMTLWSAAVTGLVNCSHLIIGGSALQVTGSFVAMLSCSRGITDGKAQL